MAPADYNTVVKYLHIMPSRAVSAGDGRFLEGELERLSSCAWGSHGTDEVRAEAVVPSTASFLLHTSRQLLCQLGQASDVFPKLHERQHLNLPATPWSLSLP